MRRFVLATTVVAALAVAAPTFASLQPIKRDFGELTFPRLRAGTITAPAGHSDGRIRVIVRLKQPPLAAVFGRSAKSASQHRLNVASTSSRAYLARLTRLQNAAAAQLKRAIPAIRLQQRFKILVDGITASVPYRALPRLVRLGFVSRVYPSLTYTLNTNESPSIISADALHARTGAMGDGVKIAVVDTGIDQTNPFLRPDGMHFPPGFPKGGKKWTTPKVIVVRAFPGPNSGREGRIGGDPAFPHGTHVSGIAAGRPGTTAPPSSEHPQVNGLSGVAPNAWLGAYRVFTIPTPLGQSANTPEIVEAFEAAVRDGMDVINFSGGGPQTDPANDAMMETVTNVVQAGVVPVISAGNDRDDFGLGSDGSPGTAPEAITVAAVTNKHVFTPTLTLDSPNLPGIPAGRSPSSGAIAPSIPNTWAFNAQQLTDIGTIVGRDGTPVDRHLCGRPNDPNGAYNPLPAGSLTGSIALVSRGFCSFVSKAARVKEAGGIGLVLVNNRAGTPSGIPVEMAVPSGMISDLDGQRLRDALAGSQGRGQIRIDTAIRQIQTERDGVVTFFSSAGPTAFGHQLKPDVSAPGGDILSSVTKALDPSEFSVFDGTSMSAPHVTGAVALLVELHPNWTPQQIKSALMTTAGPAWGDTAKTQEAPVTLEGAGLINVDKADNPLLFPDPGSLSFGDLNGNHGAQKSQLVVVSDAGGGAGTWNVELAPQSATAGATIQVPGSIDVAPGGNAAVPVIVRASAGATEGANYGFIVLRKGAETRRVPYLFLVTRPAFEGVGARKLQVWQTGTTKSGPNRASVYRYPEWAFGPPSGYTEQPPMNEGGAREALHDARQDADRQPGRRRHRALRQLAHRPVLPRLARPERRPGLRRDARQRERLHVRLPRRSRRRRSRLPASAAVLGGGRFGLRPVHGRAAPGRLPAQDVEERRDAAGAGADHDAGLGGPAADRGARARQPVRDRSVLARDRLQPGARRRGRIRSDLGARPLPAARGCADHQAGEDRGGHGSVGQPGSQERREHREQPHAEHDVPFLPHHAP